jgi:UDP-N-acetylmuramate dehydrogenase
MVKILRNISLAQYSNYKIGGPTDYFCLVKNEEELLEAIHLAKKLGLAVFILGGGTNILFSDQGFRGLVVKIENKELLRKGSEIKAGAGLKFEELLNFAVQQELAGLEWAGGLPGTVGGAVRMNAGCFGSEVKDSLKEVYVFDLESFQFKKYQNSECAFGYRSSRFQHGQEVILSAVFQLKPGKKDFLQKMVQEKINFRKSRHPLEYPNCGSFFKNVPLTKVSEELKIRFSEKIKNDPFPVLPTAVLIAALNLQGFRVGGAKVSEKHAAFIVNDKGAKASDVFAVKEAVKERVREAFGIELEEEVQLVGF